MLKIENGADIGRLVEIMGQAIRFDDAKLRAARNRSSLILTGTVTTIERRQQIPGAAKTYVRPDAEPITRERDLPGGTFEMNPDHLVKFVRRKKRQVREYDPDIPRTVGHRPPDSFADRSIQSGTRRIVRQDVEIEFRRDADKGRFGRRHDDATNPTHARKLTKHRFG